jgi:peptidoglycan pentaglycine glycine transferase (the second and third glycine)
MRNFKFEELNEKEFRAFSKDRDDLSFMQTPEVGELRKIYGSEVHFIGVKENNKVVAASMITITTTFRGKKTFYAPRGYMLDYSDLELLKYFTLEFYKYAKERNGLMIKIDPMVTYQMRDTNGNEYDNPIKNDKVINDLKDLGYIHYGFNTDIVYTQSRWNYIVKLDVPYEELVKRFSKSTRKNIESSYEKGLLVRRAKKEELEGLEEILVKTAERKKFNSRDLTYYKNMFDCLKDNMVIYVAYIEKKHFLDCAKKRLDEALDKQKEVDEKMKVDMVGNKLLKQKEIADGQVEKFTKELEEAKDFAKTIDDKKDIGVLISLKSGKEYLTLYSGYLTEYARFTPKYAMYNEHIKDAYAFKLPLLDFYGISGVFDPKDKNYGIFEQKKGFGGEVQELIGEFTYPVDKTNYKLYMKLRSLKRKIKVIKK